MQEGDPNNSGSATAGSGLKNRRSKVNQLQKESDGLDSTLGITQEIIASGQESTSALQGTAQTLRGTKNKLDKIAN